VKNLNNLEKTLYKDIFMTVFLVLVSIPIWLNFSVSALAAEANYYDNYNYVKYEFLNEASKTLLTYTDSEALRKCETQDILIYNYSNTLDNYSLLLKIRKNSSVNLDQIKINVNYQIDYLNNYHVYEDAENYYFVIDSNDIVASSQKYIISMWNIDNNLTYNNELDYEFIIV